MGIWFASSWGILMWFWIWRSQNMPLSMAVMAALAAGVFFGITMAWSYARKRKQLRLSDWETL